MKVITGRRSKYYHYCSNSSPKQEQGVVAVIVAVLLVGLVGVVGLALDLGKLYVAKTELQNSADACALAAARELSGANTSQLTLAEAAGLSIGGMHDVQFQGNQVTVESVAFSDSLDGSYQTAFVGPAAVTMRFARCMVRQSDIANWFIQVLNLVPGLAVGNQSVAAMGVATLVPSQITSCAVPIAICGNSVPPGTPRGTWIESVIGPQGGGGAACNLSGNFMWADFSPPQGGANELSGNLEGPGICNLPVTGSQVGEGGVVSSLAKAWNTRFGIYPNGNPNADKPIPDMAGFAYTETSWPAASNAFSDFQNKRGANAAYQGDANTGLNIEKQGNPVNSVYLKANGQDRRLVTVAVVDCAGFCAGNTAPVTSWACVLMLHPINYNQGGAKQTGNTRMYLEYLGRSNDADSPCATNGVPAGPGGGGPLVPALVR